MITSPERVVNIKEEETFRFVFKLNRVSTTDVSFDWSVQHISTSTDDFTGALAGSQLIRAGDTTATISIDTSDDSAYEGDENFSLIITNVIGATPSSLTARGSIIDNDAQPSVTLLSFEQVTSTATEGASFTYRLELDRASLADVSFDWSVQHSSTSTDDFTGALAGTKKIIAGSTTTDIVIDTSDDTLYEGDEEFMLIITNVTGATPSSLTASGSIIDNDPQPSITLLSFEQDYSITAEGTSLAYRLQISKASATNVSFDWSVQHSSTSTDDFTGALAGTQLIRAGDTSTTISIDTSDDSIYETDENFSLIITNVTGATPSSLTASGSIIDNDAQPSVTLLSFEQVTSTATEGASFTYRLELDRASLADVSFDWSVQHSSTSTDDFTGALAGTQLIRAGDTSTTISIDTSDDSIYETDENFSLIITNVTGATPSSLTARGSIIDNDAQPSVTLLSFEQDYSITAEGTSLAYRLQISKASATNVSFDWSVQHSSTSTDDFTGALAGTQLIRAGDTSTTISIDTSDDSIYETDENFSLIITNVTGATPSSLTASGSIIDNDAQPSVTLLSFEQDYSITAEGTSLAYRLQISKASATNVSFDWSVQHSSTSTDDFTGALAGTQLIRAGDTSTTISIDTSDDSIYEGDENFSLIITNVTGATPSSLVARGSIIDNDPQPSMSLLRFEQVDSTAIEGASFTYNLQLNRASLADVSFDWSLQHYSTNTSDFRGSLRGTKQIRAGDTTTTISIDTSDDSAYEGDENFSLIITNVIGAAPSSLVARGSIIDNDPQPSMSLLRFEQDYSITAEGTSLAYRLQISKASATNVSFDWSVQHSSTSTDDFTGALAGTQLIRAGDTSTTISIDTSDDSIYEGDENFSLIITNVTGATPSSLVARGSIIDNDPQPSMSLLRFEQVDSTAIEGASFTYNLQLNRASLADVSFDWSLQHYSTNTSDFRGSLRGTKQIRAGDTTTTISIDTSDDSAYEGDENFSLIITNVIGAAPSSLVARGSIIDNDPQPSMSLLRFEQVDSTAIEGASFTYNLQLNRASLADVSFDWSLQHYSTNTSDFRGSLRGTKQIRAGDTTTTISIDTSDDSAYEGDENFSLNITNVTGAAPSSLVARGSIIDNDPQPVIVLLSFEQVASTAIEGASFTYNLQLNRASLADVSFDWSLQHYSTNTSDFRGSLRGTKQIRAGDTTTTISIDTSDDSIYETDEIFTLNIINVIGAVPDSLFALGSILDNDPQPVITLLSFEQVASTAIEGASFTYNLQLNRASLADVSFDWSLQHYSTNTSDFRGSLRGTKQIRAGDTTTTISIDTSDDSIYETDEIFTLNIINVIGAVPDSLFALGSILDNDAQPIISFEQVASTATEGASFSYRLQLNKASALDVDFDWLVQHSSTSTDDFTGALAGTQLIRAGDTSTTISIDTSDDSIYETDENFSLIITNVTGATPSSLTARGSIIDNDAQPSVTLLSFEQDYSITAEGTSLAYRLQISKASATNVSFDWSVQHSSTSTDDFTGALAGTQLIRAGDTSTTISIDTSDDSIYETDENFSLIITNVTGATPSSLTASGSIIDNDAQPSVTLLSFEQVASTAIEGASFTYNLQLNKASLADVSFDWSLQHYSTNTSDFRGSLRGTQLIRAGDTSTTISIDTSDDSAYEGDENFSLNITNVTGAIPNSLSAGGRIIDDIDKPIISFQQDSTAAEGTSLSYRLQLNKVITLDVNFAWSVQHISTSTSDFRGALAGSQLIRAGDTTTTISIDTSDDSIYEGDESFVLHITNIQDASPNSLEAGGRIIENDAQPIISFKQDSTTTEGASLSYRLQLNKIIAVAVSFDWSVQHSSTSTSDFRGDIFGAEILFAGDTTAAIVLQINDDDRPEQAEYFTLNITNIRGATPDSLSAFITILENDIDTTADYNGNGLIDIVIQEQLGNIRYNLAGTSYKTSTSDAGKTCGGNICRGYELLGDLDLSAFANWQPIGSENDPFTSILQGNGHSIANLVIDGVDYLGLFAALSGATIDNLIVEVASIAGDSYVGALAGRATSSIIDKVQIRAANTNSTLSARGEKVGGMLGETIGTTITNVISDLNVVKDNDNADNVGGIVGYVVGGAISYVTSNGSVFVSGSFVSSVGGLVGAMRSARISYSSASGSVFVSGSSVGSVGGLAGALRFARISYSSASGSVISSGFNNSDYGGLVGKIDGIGAAISYSSASGSVTSNGINSDYYGGLVGRLIGRISYSRASGSVTSNGTNNDYYGGLVGYVFPGSTIRYSSASGNVISSGFNSNYYGGLVGGSDAEIKHSWSSSSVFSSSAAGLVSSNIGSLKFSYALGAVLPSGFGLIAENIKPSKTKIGSVDNSYWNSETSGALEAAHHLGISANIASSDTADMLYSTGSTGATIFKGFFDATDEHNRKIWTFTSGNYPVITELGIDEQAVALAYGLLRLASPYAGVSNLDSFLGGTLNNENIELIANSYNTGSTLAILDVNLLQSNSATCVAGSTDTILTTTGANGTTIALQKIAGNIEIEKSPSNSCEIIFSNQKTDGTLQLAAIISKGTASLSKKFEITLNTIQSIISLQPSTLSTSEGDELVFTLELNHRARRDVSFDWSVQHISTSTSDFTGAIFGLKTILVEGTDATIMLQINDDDRPEQAENFTLNITNIRGVTHNNLSASITILENDLDITVDYNDNGLIDIVTQEQLGNIRYNLAGTSYKTSTADAGVKCGGSDCRGYELLGNLDLSVFTNWQPIGSQNDPFTSILQGNGYSIANLAIDRGNNIGLFAALSGATIDNLVIEVVSIAGDSYVGALAGRAEQSTISRVQIRAVAVNSKLQATGEKVGGMLGATIGTTITNVISDLNIVGGGNNDDTDYVGGIIGYVSSSDISYAYSSGSVSVIGSDPDNVGGLVGYMQNYSAISYSSASSSVTSNGSDSWAYGGLVGRMKNNSTISYSSASGSVTSNGADNSLYGGLVGELDKSTISDSSASGSVTSNGADNSLYGGLVGYMQNNSAISTSSASGSVTSNEDNSDYYGGLVGYIISTSDISYSSASGSVTSSGDNSDYYGALVGYIISTSDISYSSASGSVTSSGDNSDYYGGLVGHMMNSSLSYSSASGSVTSNEDNSDYYGGLVGRLTRSSTIGDSSASGSVTSNGDENSIYGGLVGGLDKSTISDSSASGSVISNGDENAAYGGLVGRMRNNSAISTSSASASGSVTSNEDNSDYYGGLVGWISNSSVSYSSASASVTSSGDNSDYYGGLVGLIVSASDISYSSASGSVTSSGDNSDYYGGLVGLIVSASDISYSSASGSVSSSGNNNQYYGGLVGNLMNSALSYSSASGSVSSSGNNNQYYGGLSGASDRGIRHSWSSGSVFAVNLTASLVSFNRGYVDFSYAIGAALYGLVGFNIGGTITNSYWNSETSGVLAAANHLGISANIASSDTADMLASTGSAGARIFKGFADATDEHNRNIWTFTSGSYPVITELGVDKQAVTLAYGLLRLASPYASARTLDSFLGGTLNNENIELVANSYNANNTLAILDVNLLASNSATCAAGSTDIIMTTTGANGTTIALQKIAGNIEIEKSPSNSCEIIFSNQKTDGTLQLAAIISKGAASLTKKFEITLKNIQSIIALHPTKASASEGDELVFTLELNHRASRDLSFDWYLQHSSTSVEDFRGATFGDKILFAGDTTTAIRLQINDDDRPERAEDFTLNITNIRGITHNNLLASITILANDLTVDYNGNGLIDIVTQEHFDNIRHNLAGTSYKIDDSGASMNCNGNACSGYELLANLDLSSFANWQPIGSQNDPFTSILQGNGYSIANLVIDGGDYLGLFSALSGATIDNLVIEVVSIAGDSDVGALAGRAENSAISRVQIRAASASSTLLATGANIGGMLGETIGTTITNVTSDLSIVGGNTENADNVGGIVGYVSSSDISYATSSGSVFASGGADNVGGLVGQAQDNSKISYSSSSGSVSSSGNNNQYYGGLVGNLMNSALSYSSASGNVTGNGTGNLYYGGLSGASDRGIRHSWSSGSVFAVNLTVSLVSFNRGYVDFSYAIGAALYGLVGFNIGGTITNSYWNSETSGVLAAANHLGISANIASSDTADMLASTGSAGARIFKGFADATDEHNRNIWTFTSGSYPVITELGVDKQAVTLAYGLLRLASPYASARTLDSFLGGTLNNEDIELIANSYNADDTLAILDVNLLQSNSAICAAGSGDTIMTTTGANGTTIALQKIAGSIEIEKRAGNSCDIIFSNSKTDGTLQLAALISKGTASLSKKFEITLNTIQSRISLQPPTLSTREGDELVFTLELNHRARRDLSFDWYLQHSSTSVEDFRGATFGDKILFAGDTTTAIRLQINDDDRPERAEDFTLHITNIRGATPDSFSTSITILENDLDITLDYDGNGLIDIITEERFDNIRHNLAGTSYKTSDSDAGTNCGGSACRGYELLGDLDLSAFANWQPIGSQNDPFTSILQGNGYSIANLAIDGGDYLGLFAVLSGATIDNLVVEVVSITGDSDVGALAGSAENSAISRVQIRAASASSKLSATGARIGGILGRITDTTITNATSDLDVVGIGGISLAGLGGIVGYAGDSSISHAYSSASISAGNLFHSAGGLVGFMTNSRLSYSSASGSVSGSGTNEHHGGLVGYMTNSSVSYSSASGSVISSGQYGQNHGGLVGYMESSSVSYSSASGSVIDIEASVSFLYGGLVGYATNSGKIIHSWSSSSVRAVSFAASLIGYNDIDVKFSYVLGVILPSGFGLVNTNSGTIKNSYWNSETSGALEAGPGSTTNIASSDTAGMLASTGSAEARIFKGFFDATDEHNRNIWTFTSGSYPVITELGVDKQAVALAYGLLRLASPNVGASTLDSFLGGTLNNENIELIANSYNTGSTLAILDVNLLQSNSAICATGSTDSIITTTGANQAVVTLSVTSATNNLQERIVYTGCSIGFDGAAVIQAGDRLQLVATITKGLASLTKKFIINFR